MKRVLQGVTGLLVGLFFVWVLFRGTDWAEVGRALRSAHAGWLAASVVVVLLSFLTRVQRWTYIVRTAGPVSFYDSLSATQIGFLANFTLPGRVGEPIRAAVLARRAKIPLMKCMAFVALDRVTDLFGLVFVMLVAGLGYRPAERIVPPQGMVVPDWAQGLLEPAVIRSTAAAVTLGLSGVVASFVLLYVSQAWTLRLAEQLLGVFNGALTATAAFPLRITAALLRPFSEAGQERVDRLAVRVAKADFAAAGVNFLRHFAEGMHIFRSWRDMAKSIAWSIVTWQLAAIFYFCVIQAFGLGWPWYTAYVVTSTLSIAIALPGAPGFIGQFHFGIVAGLILCHSGVDYNAAKAAGIAAHLINVVCVAVVGLYFLYREQDAVRGDMSNSPKP